MAIVSETKMNVFDCHTDVVVVPVNTVGVMGKGLALAYKQKYPLGYQRYVEYCHSHLLVVGQPILHSEPFIKPTLFFPTKQHWKAPSKTEWIDSGLRYFSERAEQGSFRSYAFVPLGCGNGGLDYRNEVRPLLYKYLEPLSVDCFICF